MEEDVAKARFREAICKTPDDMQLRIKYASHLESTGYGEDLDRAEFIRLQCLAHELPKADKRQRNITKRADELLARRGRQWTAEDLRDANINPKQVWFKGGFVSGLIASCDEVNSSLEKWVESAPITELRIDWSVSSQRLTEQQSLENIRNLQILGKSFDDNCLVDFFQLPCLSNLESLAVNWTSITSDGLSRLKPTNRITRGLKELDLSHNNIGSSGVTFLSNKADHFSELKSLILDNICIDSTGLKAIHDSPLRFSLENLSLADNMISTEALMDHLLISDWPKLSKLELHSNLLDDLTIERLRNSNILRATVFGLSLNNISTAVMKTMGNERKLGLGHTDSLIQNP